VKSPRDCCSETSSSSDPGKRACSQPHRRVERRCAVPASGIVTPETSPIRRINSMCSPREQVATSLQYEVLLTSLHRGEPLIFVGA